MNVILRKQGNSTGLTIPTEVLARLRLKAGDGVTLTETPDGFVISRRDEAFERDLELVRRIVKKRRNILNALADK
jgi:putative addiction module antidote